MIRALIAMFAVLGLGACTQPLIDGHTALSPPTAPSSASGRPNFVFILGDDVGITDINAYSLRLARTRPDELFYETPNLDALVREGVAFEQSYATQLCSPTRAALLTGHYAARLGFTSAIPPTRTYFSAGLDAPVGEMPLDSIEQANPVRIMVPLEGAHTLTALPTGHALDRGRDVTTIAEALEGYRSAYLGKWHLGGHGAPGHAPRHNGFEELAWFDSGASSFFRWRGEWQRTRPHFKTSPVTALELGNPGALGSEAYLTDDLTARAVRFIREQKRGGSPFLLYLAHFAVHTPIEAPEDAVAAFAAKPQKGRKGHRNAAYAAMLASLDRSVGAVRRALEDAGLADNTYIIFMSDNGGVDWQVGAGEEPLRIAPGSAFRGTPPPTSNAPFKGGKATLYEGGVRVPLIVLGPGVTAGRWVHRPVDMTDIFPTLYQLAGFDPESLYRNPAFDGRSLVPLLQGAPADAYSKDAIVWHYPFNVVVHDPVDDIPGGPASAIRKGRYKLVVHWSRDVELFDIERDPFEKRNLAPTEPRIKEQLYRDLVDWLQDNVAPQYFPMVNPAYDPAGDPRGNAGPVSDLIAKKQAQRQSQ